MSKHLWFGGAGGEGLEEQVRLISGCHPRKSGSNEKEDRKNNKGGQNKTVGRKTRWAEQTTGKIMSKYMEYYHLAFWRESPSLNSHLSYLLCLG